MKFQIELTDGAIKNNYINLLGHLNKFSDDYIGYGTEQKGQSIQLDLGGGEVLETDVCGKYKRFRNRSALNILKTRQKLFAGDHLTIEQCSQRIWKIYKS